MTSHYEPVAIVRRSGMDESFHSGAVVGLASDGRVAFTVGDPSLVIYPRSCNKPLQAAAMLRCGLSLPSELLALVCASHSGRAEHVDGVRTILAVAGLDERALANTPDLPLDAEAAMALMSEPGSASGTGRRQPVYMNCSGKHAGMLATCAHNGWATDESYLLQDHPLQVRITEVIQELTDEAPEHIGVDGCGAPAHAFSLLGLARAFRTVSLSEPTVREAMTGNPRMVGGPGRDVTEFMEHVPGLLAKDGAEGVFAASMPDGRAVALKIADGASRARPPVMAAALALLGVDVADAAAAWDVPVLGHGQPVGEVRPAGALAGVLRHVNR